MKAVALLVTASAVALLGGCGTASPPGNINAAATSPAATTPAATTPAAPAAIIVPAVPFTAAAVKAAAETYFSLYAAGQYADVYPMIAPAARHAIREKAWTGLHDKCRPTTANLTYKVTHPILAGKTAVVTVGYAGGASALGSEQITFKYVDDRWYYQPSDLSIYRHHDLAQALAAAKAAGVC